MHISSGGVANNINAGQEATVHISAGGFCSQVDVRGAELMIYGTAVKTTVHYTMTRVKEYCVHVQSGGVASDTSLIGGNMRISSGGVASGTTVNSGGVMHISSGGVAENTFISSGGIMELAGGTARNTEIVKGGSAVLTDGIVDTLFVNANAFVETVNVALSDLTIRERGAVYASGGTLDKNEVQNLAILQLCSGTTASDTTVKSGGHLYIGSGAVHTGTLTIETGATVIAFTGSELNFSIEGRSARDAALVSDLSAVKGNIRYSITIAADQNSGIYRLADNVQSFKEDVQLAYGDELFEGFNVGESIDFNGNTFELFIENNSLLLEVDTVALFENNLRDEEDILQGIEMYSAESATLAASDAAASIQSNDPFKNGILA